MKTVFMGTMDFAVPILQGLHEKYPVGLVVTQPDRPSGRKQELKPSAVKLAAKQLGIALFQPERIRTDYQTILDEKPDLIVVAAYGQMIPDIVLDYPKIRPLNVHASLLPKYRGGSPMQRAIMNGDLTTGVTVMFMASKMDSGPILGQREIPILEPDDVGTMETKLALIGKELLVELLPFVISGDIRAKDQDESRVTFAYNIKPKEEKVDFSQGARSVFNHVRAFHPRPLAYTLVDGKKLKLYETEAIDTDMYPESKNGEIVYSGKDKVYVKAGKGVVSLKRVQYEGKKPMDIADFMNGQGRNLLVKGKIFN